MLGKKIVNQGQKLFAGRVKCTFGKVMVFYYRRDLLTSRKMYAGESFCVDCNVMCRGGVHICSDEREIFNL